MFCRNRPEKHSDSKFSKALIKRLGEDPNYAEEIIREAAAVDGSVIENARGLLNWFHAKLKNSDLNEAFGVIIATLVIMILFIIGCCQAFPCCRCCNKLRHRASTCSKTIACVLVLLCAVGLLGALCVSFYGAYKGKLGVEHSFCSVAELVDTTLNGKTGDTESDVFRGLIPAVNQLTQFSNELRSNGTFARDTREIFNKTMPLVEAMTLLTTTLANIATSFDGISNAADYHACLICDFLVDPLKMTSRQLDQGLANSLVSARDMVETKLSDDNLASFRSEINDALTMLTEQGKSLTSQIEPVLKGTAYKTFMDKFSLWGMWGIIGVCLAALAVLVFALVPMFLFLTREVVVVEESVNPYSTCLPRMACCTWCSSCIFAIVLLLVTGILMMLLQISSGACLILQDLDEPKLGQIVKALNFVPKEPGTDLLSQQVKDLLNQCVFEGGAGRLLDAIPGACDGEESCSLETQLKGMLENISAKFDELSNVDPGSIAENDDLSKLRRVFELPIASLVLLDANSGIQKDGRYMMIGADPRGRDDKFEGMQVGFFNGLNCDDGKINKTLNDKVEEEMTKLGLNDTIPGIKTFVKKLTTFKYNLFQRPAESATERRRHLVEIETPLLQITDTTCLYASTIDCPESDATTIVDTETLEGLFIMISVCDSLLEKNQPQNFDVDTFKKHFDTFNTQIELRIAILRPKASDPQIQALIDERSRDYDANALKNAQDYLMNRDTDSQSPGRMTCDVCTAGKNLLELKKRVLEDSLVNCSNRKCSVSTWLQHVRTFSAAVLDDAKNVDTQVNATSDTIKTEFQNLVKEYFLTPAQKLIDDANCNYLKKAKKEILDSFCYEGIYGLLLIVASYIASGAIATIIGFLMFFTWRHAVDNRREWSRVDDSGATLQRGHFTFRV
eukprot:GEMP01007737.1.p1 GENE.GEMP01007737.1~~GEMP01007737.1.p1  ORF type:complete len:941 (+),score=129.62 GEMP01007737.1:110-2824(+)